MTIRLRRCGGDNSPRARRCPAFNGPCANGVCIARTALPVSCPRVDEFKGSSADSLNCMFIARRDIIHSMKKKSSFLLYLKLYFERRARAIPGAWTWTGGASHVNRHAWGMPPPPGRLVRRESSQPHAESAAKMHPLTPPPARSVGPPTGCRCSSGHRASRSLFLSVPPPHPRARLTFRHPSPPPQ